MKVLIETYSSDLCHAPESTKHIDWNDSSDKKWLMSHLHWAMNNSRQVNIYSQDAEARFA